MADPDWMHSHTRLLVRANEWEASGRDDALLLCCADLASAEQWSAKGPPDDAGPTAPRLHPRLSEAGHPTPEKGHSRRFSGARRPLVLSNAPSLNAVTPGRQVAENQSRSALSQLLAARALGALDDAPDRALLLAVSAWQVKPSLEARDALFRAVENVPQARAFFASPTTLSA